MTLTHHHQHLVIATNLKQFYEFYQKFINNGLYEKKTIFNHATKRHITLVFGCIEKQSITLVMITDSKRCYEEDLPLILNHVKPASLLVAPDSTCESDIKKIYNPYRSSHQSVVPSLLPNTIRI